MVIVIKCEAMITMTAALIMVGFGASGLFRDFAVNILRYAFAVAFKLFVMQRRLNSKKFSEYVQQAKTGHTKIYVTRCFFWSERQELNLLHPAPKAKQDLSQ
jgi:type IV secretion system protein TrbL